MIDIAAVLIAAGMPTSDVAALAAALYRACQANDDDVLGHDGDALWDVEHGDYDSAREHDTIAAELRAQTATWRGLLFALEHPAAATAGNQQPHRANGNPPGSWRKAASWIRRRRQRIAAGPNSR